MITNVEDSLSMLEPQARQIAFKALRQLLTSGFLEAYIDRGKNMIVDSARLLANDPNNGDHIVRVSVAADEVFQFADQIVQLMKSADSQV